MFMKQNITARLALLTVLLAALWGGTGSVLAQQSALTATILAPGNGQVLTVGVPFDFVGSASGGNGLFYSYLWNFGDGSFGAGSVFTKTFNTAGQRTVTLTVADSDGAQASASVAINVVNPPPPPPPPLAPTVNLLVNDGDGPITVATGTAATLNWTSTNTSACAASNAWSGPKPISGSESTGALNVVGSFTYTLTCTGAGGSASDSVTINVQAVSPNPPGAPVISNIRVTDITQTSAIVRWDTNIPADSRVIYDTVSHPTLGAPPNYGYAFTTNATQDTNPRVTVHAVTLTGLTPNTQYFFRVLSQS